MEIFGRGYIIEHCISAFKISQEEKAYKIYLTDVLRAQLRTDSIPRYADLISSVDHSEKDADPEEIKDRIKNGINALRG